MSSKLHNDKSYARAVTALAKILRLHPDIANVHSRLAHYKLNPGRVKLPGFHVFTQGGEISPHAWLLPKPPGDESTLIYAYEAFADRPLGNVGRPGEVAAQVFREVASTAGRTMGLEDERIASKWKHAALLLLAYAQRYTGETVSCAQNGIYSMHISGAYMEVTPNGCYSNFRRAIVPAAIPDHRTVEKLLSLPAVEAKDPLVLALADICNDVGAGALYALNTVACGLYAGKITEKAVVKALTGRTKVLGPKPYLSLGTERTASTTLSGCDDAARGLRDGTIGDLQTLYGVLVPCAYTSRQFHVAFGNPERDPNRHVRPKTLLAWAGRIEAQAERLKKRSFTHADA